MRYIRIISLLLCVVMMTAVFTACKDKKDPQAPVGQPASDDDVYVPEGFMSISFKATGLSGDPVECVIAALADSVGGALSAGGIIADTEEDISPEAVFGETLPESYYWAFYVNGELSPTGVYVTPVTNGAYYELRAEKIN